MAKRKRVKVKYSKFISRHHFFKDPKPAPSGLIIAFGKRGCGKSATIAKKYYTWLKKEQGVYSAFYSNVHFTIVNPNSYYLDLSHHKLTDYLDPNDPVIAEYKCSTYKPENPVPFFIKHDSIICIDELGIIAHSRDFSNFPKEFIYFVKIIRKLGIYLHCTSQAYDIYNSLAATSNASLTSIPG